MLWLVSVSLAFSTAACLLIDIPYFIKVFYGCTLYLVWKKKPVRHIYDDNESFGICLPFDLDYMWHMNHGKYLRNFEYARMVLVGDSGLLQFALDLRRTNQTFVIAAAAVRYRRPIVVFERYRIVTKIVLIAGRDIFFEQWMMGLKDDFVKAVCYCKATLTPAGDIAELLRKAGLGDQQAFGPITEELHHFIELNRASSNKLNPAKTLKKLD